MKKLIAFICAVMLINKGFSQNVDSVNYLKKIQQIPSFRLEAIDSTTFLPSDFIKKGDKAVLMYFSPICSHCQHQIEEFTSNISKLNKIKFLLITSYNLKQTTEFYNAYGLSKFPRFNIGIDSAFNFGSYYGISNLPETYVYNGKGRFVQKYKTHVMANQIASILKK